MGTPAYTDDEIVEAGERLEGEGRAATPHHIHQALGGRGKYGRVKGVWTAYREAREAEPQSSEPTLSGPIVEAIHDALEGTRAALVAQLAADEARREERHRDELRVAREAAEAREAELRGRIEALEGEVDYLAELLAVHEAEGDEVSSHAPGAGSEAPDQPNGADAIRTPAADPTVGDSGAPVPMPPGPSDATGAFPPAAGASQHPVRPDPVRRGPARPVRRDDRKRGGGGAGPLPRAPRILGRVDAAPGVIAGGEGRAVASKPPRPGRPARDEAQQTLPLGE